MALALVPDPYRPEGYEERVATLEAKLADHEDFNSGFLAYCTSGLVIGLATALVATLALFFFNAAVWLIIWTGAAILGLYYGYLTLALLQEARERWQLERLLSRNQILPVEEGEAHTLLCILSEALRSLPPESREGARHLWDSAWFAHAALARIPESQLTLKQLSSICNEAVEIARLEGERVAAGEAAGVKKKQQEALPGRRRRR